MVVCGMDAFRAPPETVTVDLPEELADRLLIFAVTERVSPSAVVEHALEMLFRKNQGET